MVVLLSEGRSLERLVSRGGHEGGGLSCGSLRFGAAHDSVKVAQRLCTLFNTMNMVNGYSNVSLVSLDPSAFGLVDADLHLKYESDALTHTQ